jgi:periplasmic divalent cation tolerance protein
MTDKIVILSTCATEEEAERLARALVEERLAACVNVVPRVRSYYRWKGQIESAGECLLVIKSSRGLFANLCAALEKAHSYEVPEVLALPLVDGAARYLDWLPAQPGGRKSRPRLKCDQIQSMGWTAGLLGHSIWTCPARFHPTARGACAGFRWLRSRFWCA